MIIHLERTPEGRAEEVEKVVSGRLLDGGDGGQIPGPRVIAHARDVRHADREDRETGEIVPALHVPASKRVATAARADERDLPRAIRDGDLALALQERQPVTLAVEWTGYDVHGAPALRSR